MKSVEVTEGMAVRPLGVLRWVPRERVEQQTHRPSADTMHLYTSVDQIYVVRVSHPALTGDGLRHG